MKVGSQLQPDPNEETAALLRVLIHTMNNATFGDDVPTVPQWSGPSHMVIQVQIMLYASLATSLFSAFLATLGKQWLNHYASTEMWGTATDRSRNRQHKLDGIITWHFNHVMQSMPLMLQIALLLLGCALSRYLWEINTTVSFVTLITTSFGILFYLSIIIAGATSLSCPYQTPGAHALRYVLSALQSSMKHSIWYGTRVYSWIAPTPLTQTDELVKWVKKELNCLSWVLQTSLDKNFHLLTLKYLSQLMTHGACTPPLIGSSFSILINHIKVIKGNVVPTQPQDSVVVASVCCSIITLSHLSEMDPTSGVFMIMRQQFTRAFPSMVNLQGSPYYYSMGATYNVLHPDEDHGWLDWGEYKPHPTECFSIALAITNLAHKKYKGGVKVPCWALRFAVHFLSLNPTPSTLVTTYCLSIIAFDLGCDASNLTIAFGRYVYCLYMLASLTQNQYSSRGGFKTDNQETHING